MIKQAHLLLAAILALDCVGLSTKSLAAGCDNPVTQFEMNACAANDWHKADAELNADYKKLMAKISPQGQSKLKEAENAWLKYRDKQCEFNTLGSADGSVHGMIFANCLEDLTRRHIGELKANLDCKEGDLSCGNQ